MNLRIVALVIVATFQVDLVAAEQKCLWCKFVKFFTAGYIDLGPKPAWDKPVAVNDKLPSGLLLNPLCKGLINVMGGVLGDQIPEELGDVVSTLECGCDKVGRDIEFGCNLPKPICLKDLMGEGGEGGAGGGGGLGGLFDDAIVVDEPTDAPVAAPVTATASGRADELDICGTALYRGKLDRPLRITGDKPNLKSTACVELSGSDTNTGELATFSKQICIQADHVDGYTQSTKIAECNMYVVRRNGTFEECNSCTACPTDDLAITFDCTNIDLDESAEGEFFIPNLMPEGEGVGTCVSAGLLSANDIKTGAKGLYKPFLTPVGN